MEGQAVRHHLFRAVTLIKELHACTYYPLTSQAHVMGPVLLNRVMAGVTKEGLLVTGHMAM